MPDGSHDPARIGYWTWLRRVGWRPFALGALAVLAYQFALHFYMYWELPRGERMRGSMPFIPAALGTPVAVGWAALVALWARHLGRGWKISGRMLLAAAGWMLMVMVVFAVYVAQRDGWDTVRFWMDTIVFVTGMCVAMLPMTVFLYTGYALSKFATLLAIGIPSVGPMFLLVWSARPRVAATSHTEARARAGTMIVVTEFASRVGWWLGVVALVALGLYATLPRREPSLTLRPTFRGRPLSTDVAPERVMVEFQAYSVEHHGGTQAWAPRERLAMPWRLRDGRIEMDGRPPDAFQATIHVRRGDVPEARGDLRGYVTHTRKGSRSVELEVPLHEVIRLRRPPVGGDRSAVISPVEIEWEPIPGAKQYAVALFPDEEDVDRNDEGVTDLVTEPRWRGKLSAGTWSMQIIAVGDHDERLGQLDADRAFEVVDPAHPKPPRPANCPAGLPISLCQQMPVAVGEHPEP